MGRLLDGEAASPIRKLPADTRETLIYSFGRAPIRSRMEQGYGLTSGEPSGSLTL